MELDLNKSLIERTLKKVSKETKMTYLSWMNSNYRCYNQMHRAVRHHQNQKKGVILSYQQEKRFKLTYQQRRQKQEITHSRKKGRFICQVLRLVNSTIYKAQNNNCKYIKKIVKLVKRKIVNRSNLQHLHHLKREN